MANLRQKDVNGLHRSDSNGDREIYQYTTYGTCSKDILIELNCDIVRKVRFNGGCPGGLTAVGKLLTGLPIDKMITSLRGGYPAEMELPAEISLHRHWSKFMRAGCKKGKNVSLLFIN